MEKLFVHKGKAVALHELYEHALNNLDMFPPEAENHIRENMVSLNWIDKKMDESPAAVQVLIFEIAHKINCHEDFPFDIFSLSATVYKGRERGINVQPLINAMDVHGKWLIQRQAKEMYKDYLTYLN